MLTENFPALTAPRLTYMQNISSVISFDVSLEFFLVLDRSNFEQTRGIDRTCVYYVVIRSLGVIF
jgi:hypothetical protein